MIQALLLVVFAKMAAGTDLDLQEKYLTMPTYEFIEYFNSQNYSWKMKMYTDSHPLLPLDFPMKTGNYPIQERDGSVLNDVPVNFDPREEWPNCKTIKEIYHQGACGSCWAFATANTASDRTCIHKNIQVHLAEQDLQCLPEEVCKGGTPEDAMQFWKDKGLVTTNCKPYDIYKLNHTSCSLECVNTNISYTGDKHFAETVYQIEADERYIRAELFKNGPVIATFLVYSDFRNYAHGVYVHKVGVLVGLHAVRVLGFGVEDGIEYWLAANSWGPNWGMNGLFKIKVNHEELGFEKSMITGKPKL